MIVGNIIWSLRKDGRRGLVDCGQIIRMETNDGSIRGRYGHQVAVIVQQETRRSKNGGVGGHGRAQPVQYILSVRCTAFAGVRNDESRKVEEGIHCRLKLVGTWSMDEELADVVREAVENHLR